MQALHHVCASDRLLWRPECQLQQRVAGTEGQEDEEIPKQTQQPALDEAGGVAGSACSIQ